MKTPVFVIVRSSPPLSLSTSPDPLSPTTVPPIVNGPDEVPPLPPLPPVPPLPPLPPLPPVVPPFTPLQAVTTRHTMSRYATKKPLEATLVTFFLLGPTPVTRFFLWRSATSGLPRRIRLHASHVGVTMAWLSEKISLSALRGRLSAVSE